MESDQSGKTGLEHGYGMIDYIYERIISEVEKSKVELKERFKESYKANYRNTIDKKSQSFLVQLDKLSSYIDNVLRDFDKFQKKGKLANICA